MKPTLSIIVPVFNVAEYLKICIDSILSQSFSDFELLLIDDGSTDNSLDIIRTFVAQDKRIKYLAKEYNQGISVARNDGLALARGRYIMFVDSDDWLAKNAIEILYNKIKTNDLVIASYYKSFENKSIRRKLNLSGTVDSFLIKKRLFGLTGAELKDPSQQDSLVTVWSKMYKKSIIEALNIQFVPTNLIGSSEDLLFNIAYLKNTIDVHVIDKPIYHYRKTQDSYTNTYKAELYSQWQVLFSMITQNNVDNNAELDKALQNRIALSIIGLGLNELKNPKGNFAVLKKLKYYLSDKIMTQALSQLDFSYFKSYWSVFFIAAKYRLTIILFLLLKIIARIIKK